MNARAATLITTSQFARAAAALSLCLTLSRIAFCGPIHDATRKGDEAKVVALLKQNSDLVSSRDKLGNTPLHIAALHDQLAIATLLVANGADVNARNDPDAKEVFSARFYNKVAYGETPLCLALLSFHHKELVELLLTHGADPNAIVHIQDNPLHRAVEHDLPYDVELLLANGADPDTINLSGLTCVHSAVTHGQTKILELLLDYGANANAKDGAGHTPMYYAQTAYRSYYGETSSNEKAIAILKAHGGHL
jgi:ankyrin repeat protein